MANPEHLEILKHQGVKGWNDWRKAHPGVESDLSGADLEGAKLHGVNFSGANLHRAQMSKADLNGADLTRAIVAFADLSGAGLREAALSGADLWRAGLSGTDLWRAGLSGTDLREADLSDANLSWADLTNARLNFTNLSGANLSGADIMRADLHGAHLSGANFTAALVQETHFSDMDLSTAKGLEAIEHYGPSTIGIDTFYKSRGNIPEVFLRGCGVPDEFIAYIGSMVGRPIEFYSCFVSYSTHDQEFAERLHADLQGKGVRCWFAPEDLKIGEKFQEKIEESIRLHDKLLLVLSENSVLSPWVEREVQAAFEREHKSNKLVLFPIRLDDAVMKASKAWAADIRRTRHIGEFGNWRENSSYKKALKRLLRDLKAETAAPSGA